MPLSHVFFHEYYCRIRKYTFFKFKFHEKLPCYEKSSQSWVLIGFFQISILANFNNFHFFIKNESKKLNFLDKLSAKWIKIKNFGEKNLIEAILRNLESKFQKMSEYGKVKLNGLNRDHPHTKQNLTPPAWVLNRFWNLKLLIQLQPRQS